MIVAAVAATAALVISAAYAVAGFAGLVTVTGVAGALALLAVRLAIRPAPAAGAGPEQPPRADGTFTSYRRVHAALIEAGAGQQRFDQVTRPVLTGLLAALLADRRRVDLMKNPAAARLAIGDDVWPLLDPARPAVSDPAAAGITINTLTRIADRLEEL